MRFAVLDVLRLFRIHTAMVTASVPGIAAYLAGGGPFLIAGVVMGSIMHHCWGFSLNEIMDLEVDRRDPDLSHKPLVSGRISKSYAHLLSLLALFASFCLFGIGAFLDGGDLAPVMLFLGLATITGGIYDLYGKKFPLSDIFVAMWLGLLVLAAGSAVSGSGPYEISIWAIALLGALHILFNNSVEGGLKDVENDRVSGARTFAVVTGSRRSQKGLEIPRVFRYWGVILRAAFILVAAVFSFIISQANDWGPWIVILVSIWGIFLFWHGLGFMRSIVKMDRRSLIATFTKHELMSFTLSLLVVLPQAGIPAILITLSAPVIWTIFFNRIMFKTTLAPKV